MADELRFVQSPHPGPQSRPSLAMNYKMPSVEDLERMQSIWDSVATKPSNRAWLSAPTWIPLQNWRRVGRSRTERRLAGLQGMMRKGRPPSSTGRRPQRESRRWWRRCGRQWGTKGELRWTEGEG